MRREYINTKPFIVTVILLHIPFVLTTINFVNQLINNFNWLDLFGFVAYCLLFCVGFPYNFYILVKQEIEEKIQQLIIKHGRTIKNNKMLYLYLHINIISNISTIFVIVAAIFHLLSKNYLYQLAFYGLLTIITVPIVLYYELKK